MPKPSHSQADAELKKLMERSDTVVIFPEPVEESAVKAGEEEMTEADAQSEETSGKKLNNNNDEKGEGCCVFLVVM